MRKDATLLGAAAMVVCLAIYWNALDNGFRYDDIHSIVQNPDIRSLWPPYWLLPTDAVHEAVNSRPVASFTLAVNYAFGGLALAIDPDFAAARQGLAGVLQQKDAQF